MVHETITRSLCQKLTLAGGLNVGPLLRRGTAQIGRVSSKSASTHRELAVQLVESTCLHELVHLLNYKHPKKVRGFTDGGGAEIKEMGKAFEKEAYGKDVGSEGWMRMAAVLVLIDAAKGDLRHKLAPTVQVTIDGKPKPLGALQKGMRARATPVRIEALDKNKDFAK